MDRALLQQQLASIHEHAGHAFSWEMPETGQSGEIFGTLSDLRPDDPRVAGRTERLLVLTVATHQLTPRPRGGMELESDGLFYAIQRLDDHRNTGQTEILLAAPTRRLDT
jgi:hypothetical protein